MADLVQQEVAAPLLVPPTVTRVESPRRRALRRFLRHRLALVGLFAIATIAVLAVVGSEEAALRQNLRLGIPNQAPGKIPGALLGTDALGRDVLARTLVGGRISILVALVSVGIAAVIGTTIGVIAGYAGGRVDNVMMRFVDIVLSFPIILLLIVVAYVVGPGLVTMMVMIGAVTWAQGARIIRGQVLALRETAFIEAARVVGVSGPRMIGSHILPNIVAPLVVYATFMVATVIVFEASLSYLGLCVQPPTPSWGNLVQQTRVVTVLERYPWQWAPAAGFIVIMVLAVNFVGDGLRDAFDRRAMADR